MFVAACVAACTDSVVEAIACGTMHAVSQRLGVVVYMKLSVFSLSIQQVCASASGMLQFFF